jgi:gamma-tubulin complex component 3
MIEQSLCHHLHSQLTEYYKLIAVLESQMSMGVDYGQHHGNPIPDNSDPARREEIGLTLRRLDVWIDEWRLRMRMMSVCVEGARGDSISLIDMLVDNFSSTGAHGGALVNLIHGYTDNGDPFVRKFTDQLLEEVNDPYMKLSIASYPVY